MVSSELASDELLAQLINQLINESKNNEFLTIEDILNNNTAKNLPLDELDRVIEVLLDSGVLLHLDAKKNETTKVDVDQFYDRSHIDYESVFARVLKIDNSLTYYINEIRQIPSPRVHEERRLIVKAREGNNYARDRIISMFLKVVVRIALWYYDNYSLPLNETIQEGNIGLTIAVEKMPLTPEYRFSSYAPWWIRQNIDRSASLGFCDCFYIPVHLKEKLFKVAEIKKKYACDEYLHDQYCSKLIFEISQYFSIDKTTAISYVKFLEEPVSIEEYLYENNHEKVFSDNGNFANSMFDNIIQKVFSDRLQEICSELNPRELDVIERRYGFGSYDPMSLEEIAGCYEVTRERIRQIEAKAKTKLIRNKFILEMLL